MLRTSRSNSLVGDSSRKPRGRGAGVLLFGTACIAALTAAPAAKAQQNSQVGEVVVTARKRQESILNVPVIETAVPAAQLQRMQINNLNDLQTLVPGLVMGAAPVASGMQVSIRGIGTTSSDPSVDQSILLNIDGQQFSQGLAYYAGMFDVGQVEVLKGPQAMFYGKSATAGVIALRTADPTNKKEIIAQAGYDFESRARRASLILSGPVTDTLKLRLAGMYNKSDGYYENPTGPGLAGTGANAASDRLYGDMQYIIRATALWNPTDNFSARFKATFSRDHLNNGGVGQYKSCPDGNGPVEPFAGVPFISNDDCKLNRTFNVVAIDPGVLPGGLPFGGQNQLNTDQGFSVLELNYNIKPDLTLTSTTAYYLGRSIASLNGGATTYAGSPFWVLTNYNRREVTQEVRLNSDFSGNFNFTTGLFYENGQVHHVISLPVSQAYYFSPAFPPNLGHGDVGMTINSISLFGQGRYKITPDLEFAAGLRWTNEKRTNSVVDYNYNFTDTTMVIPVGDPKISSGKLSPEITLTWKPKDTMTVFGSLKQGWKSGSYFMGGIAKPGQDVAYGDERVRGGEMGFKSRLFDRTLAFDASIYDYVYTGLQVGVIEQASATGVPQSRTVNAGKSTIRGIETTIAWRPPQVEGLTVNLAAAYNHGKFNQLNNIPCNPGQTIAQGCDEVLNPLTGLYTAQDLSGTSLPDGPKWQVNGGFDYQLQLPSGMSVNFSETNAYTSRFLTTPGLRADFWQGGYFKADATIQLNGIDDKWEIALIGKNLGASLTTSNCSASNGANGSILGGDVSGGVTTGPAGAAEVLCRMESGREVWLRFTLKPFG
jgi:iron complex outermembrane receptor protein